MKRINAVFVVLLVLLVFNINWNTFNEAYQDMLFLIGYNQILEEGYERIDITISTHALETDAYSVREDMVSFLNKQDYLGYISTRNEVVGEVRERALYISSDNLDFLNHLYFYEDLDIDFKSENETQYITNDLNDDAFHIKYLDQSFHDVKGEFPRSKYVYRPIYQILESRENLYDEQIGMVFVVPTSEVTRLKELLSSEFLVKYGICDVNNLDCQDEMIFNTSYLVNFYENEYNINFFNEPFRMPKPILYISSVSVLITCFVFMMQSKKEFATRKLMGNSDGILSKRIVLPFLIESFAAYFITLFVLMIWKTDIFDPMSVRFNRLFIMPSIFFSVALMGVLLVIYISIKLKAKVTQLKVSFGSAMPFVLSSVLKIGVCVIVGIPFIQAYNTTQYFSVIMDGIGTDEVYLNSRLLGTPEQPFYPYLSPLQVYSGEWNRKADEIHIELLQNYDFIYADTDMYKMDYSYSEDDRILPYVVVNEGYLNYYEYMYDGQVFSSDDMNNNFIIVPKVYQTLIESEGIYDNKMPKGEIVFVDTTHTIPGNEGYVGIPLSDAILYVMVDDYSMFNYSSGGMRKPLISEQDFQQYTEGMQYINENLATTTGLMGSDMLDMGNDILDNYRINTIYIFIIFMIVVLLFSYQKAMLFFEGQKKKLIVRTLHGHGFMSRYYVFFVEILLTGLLVYAGLSRYNQTEYGKFDNALSLNHRVMVVVLVMTLEAVVAYVLIKRFQKNNMVTYLKGSE